jgi:hypothetical protein
MVEARRHENWMIYSLPAAPSRELALQLGCLQDCVRTEAVFQGDVSRLKALGPKCNWIPKALKTSYGTKPPGRAAAIPSANK